MMSNLVFVAALVFIIGCNLYFGPRIKADKIAMQWDSGGRPTWFAPKAAGLWFGFGLLLLVRAFIWALMTYAPSKVHGAPDIGIIGMSVIVAACQVVVLIAALRANK